MAQSRIEAILENILGAGHELLDPASRNEMLLIQILEQFESVPNQAITSAEIDEIINTVQ